MCDAAPELLRAHPPMVALREWMDRYVDYMTTKIGMAAALRAVIAGGANPYARSRELLGNAIAALLDAGAAEGRLRADVSADDVLIGLSGIAMAAGAPGQRAQAGRLLDLMVDGLRRDGAGAEDDVRAERAQRHGERV